MSSQSSAFSPPVRVTSLGFLPPVICSFTESGLFPSAFLLSCQIFLTGTGLLNVSYFKIFLTVSLSIAYPSFSPLTSLSLGYSVVYLLDFVKPNERYSVADYKKDAKNAIKEIIAKGKIPIVVGGTGLYINSLIYEIDYPGSSNGKRYYGTTDNLSTAFTGDYPGQQWRDQVDEYNKIGIKYEDTGAIELSFTR